MSSNVASPFCIQLAINEGIERVQQSVRDSINHWGIPEISEDPSNQWGILAITKGSQQSLKTSSNQWELPAISEGIQPSVREPSNQWGFSAINERSQQSVRGCCFANLVGSVVGMIWDRLADAEGREKKKADYSRLVGGWFNTQGSAFKRLSRMATKWVIFFAQLSNCNRSHGGVH